MIYKEHSPQARRMNKSGCWAKRSKEIGRERRKLMSCEDWEAESEREIWLRSQGDQGLRGWWVWLGDKPWCRWLIRFTSKCNGVCIVESPSKTRSSRAGRIVKGLLLGDTWNYLDVVRGSWIPSPATAATCRSMASWLWLAETTTNPQQPYLAA